MVETRIVKIIGLPGTGKTTVLSKILTRIIREEAEIYEIIFSSFSRSTMKAIFERTEEIGYKKNDLPYFRTLHSLSARVLDLTEKDRFITEIDYKAFCSKRGIPWEKMHVRTIDEIEEFGMVGDEYVLEVGNTLFRWWQLLKKRYIYPKDIITAIRTRSDLFKPENNLLASFPVDLIFDWFNDWEQYKTSNGKYEWDDAMQEIVLNHIPFIDDIRYMFIDEAQDLSPLQFEVVKLWMRDCDEVYFAYDVNQCLYFFNAADPKLVDEIDGDIQILSKSYRVPQVPWEYARGVAHIIGDRTIDHVEPADNEGDLSFIDYEDAVTELTKCDDKTFVLFRTHYAINKFLAQCLDHGLLFHGFGRTRTIADTGIFNDVYSMLKDIYAHKRPQPKHLRTLILNIPAAYLKRGIKTSVKRDEIDLLSRQRRLEGDEYLANFYSYFREVDDVEKLKEIITDPKSKIPGKTILLDVSPNTLPIKNNVYVGTVFASKGLESNKVFLFDYFPHKEANIRKEECRLIFVGITREREDVYIVAPDYETPFRYGQGLVRAVLEDDGGRWL